MMTPHKLRSRVLSQTLFALALLLVSANAEAQVRIQGIPVKPVQIDAPPVDNMAIMDYREKMRQFVQSVSEYGRRIKQRRRRNEDTGNKNKTIRKYN